MKIYSNVLQKFIYVISIFDGMSGILGLRYIIGLLFDSVSNGRRGLL